MATSAILKTLPYPRTPIPPYGVKFSNFCMESAESSAMKPSCSIPFVLLSSLILAACAQPAAYTLRVEAGDYDRRQTITSFTMPEGLDSMAFQLRDDEGALAPLQIDPDGTAWFILNRLDAGQTKTYRLEPAQTASPGGVVAQYGDGTVHLSLDAQPVVQYYSQKSPLPPGVDSLYHRGGYLHPVYTPAGRVVTDDYPPSHLHQNGIWASWTKTVFQGRTPDFWNLGNGTGTVEVEALDETWGGPVHGGLRARHRYVDLTASEPVTALREQWELRIYRVSSTDRPIHLFDLAVTQTTATDSALVLPTYHYGGVGFRGHWDWNGEENTVFLTSEGNDRSNGHATRARWCHIGGVVEGDSVGIAVLGHPDNFEAPQPMRIHPTEPFFNYAPSQAGDWSIEPGELYVARYRFVVYDGLPDPADLDRLWNDYAHPPVVHVGDD